MVGDERIAMLRNAGMEGISEQADELRTGANSGHQAINVAVLAGSKRIVLVGYDAKAGSDGRKHFFGNHPDNTEAPYLHMKAELRKCLWFFKVKGIEVLNASTDSALDFFPQVNLVEALGD